MANAIKALVRDTAVYGLSSMVGKFLNWLLTFVYVRVLVPEEFGRMTNLYAWTALLMIVLTYGMETSFFRFASRSERPGLVYSTALASLCSTALVFVALGGWFASDVGRLLGVAGQDGLVALLVGIIALDAVSALPLGYLRYAERPWRFMSVRMTFVALTIVLTLLMFYAVPQLVPLAPNWLGWYSADDALYYILGINLVGNIVQLAMLAPTLRWAERAVSLPLLRRMLGYALPILLLGLVGSFNNQADKILFPLLFDDRAYGNEQLGIYGACYKLAVVMVLFTQAFRYAYDPFVFARSREGGEAAKAAYADAMKYYTIFTLFIFVVVVSALDVLKFFIAPAYYAGLPAVAPVMAGQLMFGIYFNLSLWYKLTDRTWWGAALSLVGCVATVLVIVWGAPHWGFMACAWASVLSNGLIMLLSYFLGQRYYPVRYPLGEMGVYAAVAFGIVGLEGWLAGQIENEAVRLGANALLAAAFLAGIIYREVPRAAVARLVKRLHR